MRWQEGLLLLVALILIIAILVLEVDAWKRRSKGGRPLAKVFTTGVTPAGMALSVDRRYLYIANNNNYGLTGQDSVTVWDVKHNRLVTTIFDASFNQPYTVTAHPNGKYMYITNSAGSTITIVSTSSNTVSGLITGFDGPSGMAIVRLRNVSGPKQYRGYVNNYGAAGGVGSGNGTTVVQVDLTLNAIVGAPITVGLAPASVAPSHDGKSIYVINYVDGNIGTGTMSIIDVTTNTVTITIPGFSGPFGLAVNSKHVYVTNFGSNNFEPFGTTLSVVCLKSNSIQTNVQLGIQSSGVALSPDGRYVLVSNYNTLYAGAGFTDLTAGEGTVNIIDTHSYKVLSTVPVGQSPSAIVTSCNQAFVSNFTSNTVSVIQLPKH
jgi:YVTN family beta-propeller protein